MTKDMRKDYRGNDEALNVSSLQVNGLTTKQLITSGLKTTVGGQAAEDFTVTGMLATDTVVVSLLYGGASSRYITALPVLALNKFTVTFSGDPGSTAKIQYAVFR